MATILNVACPHCGTDGGDIEVEYNPFAMGATWSYRKVSDGPDAPFKNCKDQSIMVCDDCGNQYAYRFRRTTVVDLSIIDWTEAENVITKT